MAPLKPPEWSASPVFSRPEAPNGDQLWRMKVGRRLDASVEWGSSEFYPTHEPGRRCCQMSDALWKPMLERDGKGGFCAPSHVWWEGDRGRGPGNEMPRCSGLETQGIHQVFQAEHHHGFVCFACLWVTALNPGEVCWADFRRRRLA